MKTAKPGDVVKILYTGESENGEVLEASADTPVEFTIGSHELIGGLEKNVIGMQVGEKKTFTVLPEEGFGAHQKKLVETVNKDQFPAHITPRVGQRLRLKHKNGDESEILVTGIDGERVTLDANHPLCGQTLNFEIELVGIR
jgi:FKBP-type peptidyl-prolyl cis-trans isomerase 2